MVINEISKRVDIFHIIYTLISANKISGSFVFSAYPEINPSFPCYIIDSANIEDNLITLNGNEKIDNITISIELFSKSSEGKKKIDELKDNVEYIIKSNKNNIFNDHGLQLININDISNDTFIENNQKINYSAINITYRYN